MKYTVNRRNSEEYVLMKNDMQSFCPFSQPFPIPSGNDVNIMRMPCSTQCPHAIYDGDYWSITCAGGVKQVFEITEHENKHDLKVI
jgi:hypothetical protein